MPGNKESGTVPWRSENRGWSLLVVIVVMERSSFMFASTENPEFSTASAAKAAPDSAPAASTALPLNNSRRVKLVIGTFLFSRWLTSS